MIRQSTPVVLAVCLLGAVFVVAWMTVPTIAFEALPVFLGVVVLLSFLAPALLKASLTDSYK